MADTNAALSQHGHRGPPLEPPERSGRRSRHLCAIAVLQGLLAGFLEPALALGQAATAASRTVDDPAGGAFGPALWLFYFFGGLTVLGATATITRRNPVVAAVCLVGTLAATAGLYLLLHATFIAAMQVLVYAGAIMVLFVFVVMAVERPEEEELVSRGWGTALVGIAAITLLLVRLLPILMDPLAAGSQAEVGDDYGTIQSIGRLLFTTNYLFPFEALSLLLLVAIVGAVVVNRRPRPQSNSGKGAKEPATSGPRSPTATGSAAARDRAATAQHEA